MAADDEALRRTMEDFEDGRFDDAHAGAKGD